MYRARLMKQVSCVLLTIVLAACGGKSKPAAPPPPDTTAVREAPPAEEEAAAPAEPPPPAPDPEVLAQAELAEQYELGKQVYSEKKCDTCHGADGKGNAKNPAVIGDKAFPAKPAKTAKLRKGVTFTTAADVMAFVKKHMPAKAPGTLADDEAAAVTAWMLSESKVEINRKLDADNAAAINLR
jgi:mono/diheme cytochrome c family protein